MSQRRKSILFDVILIAIINSFFGFLFIKMDMLERFYDLSRHYEFIELDELLPLGLVFLLSIIYFICRRWYISAAVSVLAEENANKDTLTKLLNRRTLESKLGAEWDRFLRYHEDFCVVLLDLDDFSDINDNLGYIEGDRVLIDVANMINNNTRKTDSVARWGEEEFLILCPVCNSEQGTILAEKLRANLYRMLKDGVELSASFAVAQSNKDSSLEELLKRVHLGLHKAKGRGKNCVVSV